MSTKPKTPPAKKPANKPSDETPDDEETPDDDDDETPDETAEEKNQRLNAMVTNRVKREMKPLLKAIAELKDSFGKLSTPAKPEDEETETPAETPAEDKGKKKPAEPDPGVSRKLTRLERELNDERAARKKAEDEKTAELERGKKAEMRNAFSAILTEHGVTDRNLLRSALGILEEDGIMVRDEDGKVKFKGTDKYGIEQMFDPKVGLKSWLGGEGKSFVPAVDAGGSGTGGSKGIGNTNFSAKDLKGMNPKQLASINLERACAGLAPLGEEAGN